MTPSPDPITLDQIADRLREPFPPDLIKFLPKTPQQREGRWFCLALPYTDKRVYEDRLNLLAPGQWQTPPITALVAGNKLLVFSTVILCGIAHTDVGEAFLSSVSRKGELRDEENTATDAYAQAFKRACAQFGLGRYLYELPKIWLPYDPEKRLIALSPKDYHEAVLRLYRKVGLLPADSAQVTHAPASSPQATSGQATTDRVAIPPTPAQATPPAHPAEAQRITADELAWVRKQLGDDPKRVAQVCQHYQVTTLDALTAEQTHDLIWKHLVPPRAQAKPATAPQAKPEAAQPAQSAQADTPEALDAQLREQADRITPYQHGWVERQLNSDPKRIAAVCQSYHVEKLADLSGQQARHLVDRLLAQQAKARQARTAAKAAAQ